MKVTGSIDAPGYGALSDVGFCCNTHSKPDMTDRQKISRNVSDTQFEAVYKNLHRDSVYYFRVWATNSYGYVLGTELVLSLIHI